MTARASSHSESLFSQEDSAGSDPLMSPGDIGCPGSSGVTGDFVGINTDLRMREMDHSVLEAPPLAVIQDS